MYRDGVWISFETTVCWLEVDGEGLIQVDKTFSSIEDRQAWIKERIESGLVYDLLWHSEGNYGGEPGPDDDKIDERMGGFV